MKKKLFRVTVDVFSAHKLHFWDIRLIKIQMKKTFSLWAVFVAKVAFCHIKCILLNIVIKCDLLQPKSVINVIFFLIN